MKRYNFLKAEVELSWGYSIKTPGATAAKSTLLVPPPSTLIGALARSIGRIFNWGECFPTDEFSLASTSVKILQFIKSASLSIVDKRVRISYWADISRTCALQYLRRTHRKIEEMQKWFGIHSTGKIYAPSLGISIVYVVDYKEARKVLGRNWQQILKQSVASIIAIGSKEGIVIVNPESIELTPVKMEKGCGKRVKTHYYFPKDAITEVIGKVVPVEVEYWSFAETSAHWRLEGGTSERINYVLPIDQHMKPITVEAFLSDNGIALEDDEDTIIVLKKWFI